MKEKPSSGSGEQRVFSSKKRPVVALLAITVILCCSWLFASAGQTYAAPTLAIPTPTPIVTPTGRLNSPSVNLDVLQGDPTSLRQNESLILVADPQNFFHGGVTKVEFYFSTGGSPPTLIGTDLTPDTALGYSMSWSSPDPGTYSLTAIAYDPSIVTSNSVTATVVTGTAPPFHIVFTSPTNGSVYTLPNQDQIPLSTKLDGLVIPSGVQPTYTVSYSATLEPNGPVFNVGTVTPATNITPGNFTFDWYPTYPSGAGTYSVVATVSLSPGSGRQSATSAPITVQVNVQACNVSYQLESQWAGGFNVNIVLTNTGTVPINGWTLLFAFPGDQEITQLWNGSYTQTSENVSITNLSYNRSIAPRGTVNFGFNGSWVSNDTSPIDFELNRIGCSG